MGTGKKSWKWEENGIEILFPHTSTGKAAVDGRQ